MSVTCGGLGFCYGREARSRVCRTIHPETVQRTLIRGLLHSRDALSA